MSFNNGDVVKLSATAKALWTVQDVNTDGTLNLKSEKGASKNNVSPDGLILVTAARNAVHASEDVLNAILIPQSTLSDEELDAVVRHTEPNDGFSPETWVLHEDQVEELDEVYADHGMAAAQERKREMLAQGAEENPVVAEWNNTYTVPSKPYTADLIQGLHPAATHVLHIDGQSLPFKSYGAAADALVLAQRGKFNHAAIDTNGRRLVERSTV